jgi:raffinose/stachyose/melibiose transport system substrate-binding protein
MKKVTSITMAALLVIILALTGCGSSKSSNDGSPKASESQSASPPASPTASQPAETQPASTEEVKLTAYLNTADKPVQDVYKQIADAFMKENPSIKVDYQFPGDYENVLKVKMAANDLPDIFDTHGWAIIRYGKYLADLKDQPWVGQMTDTIKDVVTDKEGKVYVLVTSEAKDGLTYNVDLLNQYNIQPPKTFDELMAAAEKLKKDSGGKVTPFFFSGVDDWMIGQFFDYFATSLLISPEQNEGAKLLDGSFDWKKWTQLPEKFLEMYKKGYMNKDVLTAKYSDLPAQFAQGQVAFTLLGPSFADEVHKTNPNVKIGFMPVPSMVAGDEPNFSGGERNTMGVWKDSKHPEQAKKLIAYFAQPDNMAKIANVTKLPPGLKGVTSQHDFSPYYEQYASVRVFPYFDRVYLPNGMWDVMCKTGSAMLGGTVTPAQYSDKMKQEVSRLKK